MSSLVINTSEGTVELSDKNKELIDDLFFANKCRLVLSYFKQFLELIFEKYENTFDSNDKHFYEKLVKEAEEVLNRNKISDNNNNVKIKVESIDSNATDDETEEDMSRPAINSRANKSLNGTSSVPTSVTSSVNSSITSSIASSLTQVKVLLPDGQLITNSIGFVENNNLYNNKSIKKNVRPKTSQKAKVTSSGQAFICGIDGCERSFPRKSNLSRHVKGFHTEATITCTFKGCDRKFKKAVYLKSHLAHIHNVGKRPKKTIKDKHLKCPAKGCYASFPQLIHLNKHIRTTHYRSDYLCTVQGCDKVFKDNEKLKTHLYRGHSQDEPQIRCKWSGCEFFGIAKDINRHKLTHKSDIINKYKYICGHPDCHFRAPKSWHLKIHIEKKHNTEREDRYVCDVCSQGFNAADKLVLHSKCEHSIEKPFTCDYPGCSYSCRFRKSLVNHKRTHEPCVLSFVCTELGCDKAFSQEKNLKRHLTQVHYEKDKHRCEWPGCDYSAPMPQVLKRHHLIHTKERNFVCDVDNCGQRFRTKHEMGVHKRSYHKLGPLLSCQWPGCEFTTYHPITYYSHVSHHKSRNN